jgi:glucose-6-phosphate dehydrogenase assembly protein OpcA
MSAGSEPEGGHWRGEGVRVEEVSRELDRLHRDHQRDGAGHALTRTLNLIVLPGSPDAHVPVDGALADLGVHSPSRTLILRRHAADRLDAEADLECRFSDAAGEVGVCREIVVLSADEERLVHAASLVAPLLLADLPTVLWLPDAGSPIPDPRLLERSQQVLVDSALDGAPLGRLIELTSGARVHDLAWGRLDFWRAATAAAFERPERRSLLPRVSSLEVSYEGETLVPAALLAGWVTARAGWRAGRLERDGGRAAGIATRPDGGELTVALERDPAAHGCGGIEALTLRAGSSEVRIARGAATSRLRDLFAEALRPLASYDRGYAEALGAAATMTGDAPPP